MIELEAESARSRPPSRRSSALISSTLLCEPNDETGRLAALPSRFQRCWRHLGLPKLSSPVSAGPTWLRPDGRCAPRPAGSDQGPVCGDSPVTIAEVLSRAKSQSGRVVASTK